MQGAVRAARVEDAQHGLSRYTGNVASDVRDGFGAMRYANNEVYVGEWQKGRRCGSGVYYYADGAMYDGWWEDDKAHGVGMCRYPTGNIYSGEWSAGRVSGRGAMFYCDGDAYDGEWSEGRLHGYGKFYNRDGEVHEGRWYEDQAIQNDENTPRRSSSSPNRIGRQRIAARRKEVAGRTEVLEEVHGMLKGFISLGKLDAARDRLSPHSPAFEREVTEPVNEGQKRNPLSMHSPPEAMDAHETQEAHDAEEESSGTMSAHRKEDDDSSSGVASSFSSDEETRGEEMARMRDYYDRVKRQHEGGGSQLTWADLARSAQRDPGELRLGLSHRSYHSFHKVLQERSSVPNEASWASLQQGIQSKRDNRRRVRESRRVRAGSAAESHDVSVSVPHSRQTASPIRSRHHDDDSASAQDDYSGAAFSETKSDFGVVDSEAIRLPLYSDDIGGVSEPLSKGDFGMWRMGAASTNRQAADNQSAVVTRAALPHGSPDRAKSLDKVLSLCGPADEPFSVTRFTHLFVAMLLPYPFVSCSPLAVTTTNLERKYVVSGAPPRWIEEPGDYLCYSYVALPLVVAMFVASFASFGQLPKEGAVIAPSDIALPPTFLILLALTVAARAAFPRKKAHFLESLPDAQFNLLASFTYSKIRDTAKIDENWDVTWASDEYGGGHFVHVASTNIVGCAFGLLVAMAIPLHRLFNGDAMWGSSDAELVITTTGTAAVWLCCMGLYGLIFRVLRRQRQLLSQLLALTYLAELSENETGSGQGKLVFDLSVTGLADPLFCPEQIEDLKSLLGWYICRSFVLHGSPVMNHNSRSAVISVNVFAVMSVSVLLMVTFLYDAVVSGLPEITDRCYTTASVFLVLTTPLLIYHIWLWKRVRYCYKKHRIIMSSAATSRCVQVLGTGGGALDQEANLISGLADYMSKHDYNPRCLGLKVSSWMVLLLGVIIALAMGTLVYRWLRLGINADDSPTSNVTVPLGP